MPPPIPPINPWFREFGSWLYFNQWALVVMALIFVALVVASIFAFRRMRAVEKEMDQLVVEHQSRQRELAE